MLASSPSEMLGAGGWLCLELGDSLSALLKVWCLLPKSSVPQEHLLGVSMSDPPLPFPGPPLLQGARLYSAWYGRPSTGSFFCRSSWAVGPRQQCGSALPTMCTTSSEPSWWTGESSPESQENCSGPRLGVPGHSSFTSEARLLSSFLGLRSTLC